MYFHHTSDIKTSAKEPLYIMSAIAKNNEIDYTAVSKFLHVDEDGLREIMSTKSPELLEIEAIEHERREQRSLAFINPDEETRALFARKEIALGACSECEGLGRRHSGGSSWTCNHCNGTTLNPEARTISEAECLNQLKALDFQELTLPHSQVRFIHKADELLKKAQEDLPKYQEIAEILGIPVDDVVDAFNTSPTRNNWMRQEASFEQAVEVVQKGVEEYDQVYVDIALDRMLEVCKTDDQFKKALEIFEANRWFDILYRLIHKFAERRSED